MHGMECWAWLWLRALEGQMDRLMICSALLNQFPSLVSELARVVVYDRLPTKVRQKFAVDFGMRGSSGTLCQFPRISRTGIPIFA